MAAPLNVSDVQNSALDVVRSFYEPNQSFSSVFINNKTVSVDRNHHWGTKRQFAQTAKSSIFSSRCDNGYGWCAPLRGGVRVRVRFCN